MKTIDNLSHGGKIRRLRELAEAVLTQYELGNARISLLSRRENSMFQVLASPVIRRSLPEFEAGDEEYEDDSEDEDEEMLSPEAEVKTVQTNGLIPMANSVASTARADRSRYALRLYTSSTISSALILSELQWLSALRRDTGLAVPEPVLARNGSLLTELTVEGTPETIRGVLFRWVEGRFVDAGLAPTHLERLGVLMARMHHHAKTFSPPSGFVRPRWQWQRLFDEESLFNPRLFEDSRRLPLSEQQRSILKATALQVESEMRSLPQDNENYGLIHSDLQQTNYLFYKDEARAIDFEECCFGYYLFDMAVTLGSVMGRAQEAAMREAFFRGYASMRTLPARYEEHIQTFTALRLLEQTNALLRTIHTYDQDWVMSQVLHTLDSLERCL